MRRRSLLALTVLCATALWRPVAPASADAGYVPPVSFALATIDAAADNQYYDYGWASNTPSLFQDGIWPYKDWVRYPAANAAYADIDGDLLVLTNAGAGTFGAITYDGSTLTESDRRSTAIDIADGWRVSGFHYGPDDHIYALQRRSNESADPSRTVMRVLRYDRALNLVGTADIAVQDIPEGLYEEAGKPKDMGTPSFTMRGTWLVVPTAREKLPAPHHESNVTFLIDTTAMSVQQTAAAAYVSHSMNQFVATRGSDAVFVDHGDGLPRAIQLAVAPGYFSDPAAYDAGEIDAHSLFAIQGAAGANFTGVTVNGVAAGNDRVLVTGVAQPHDYTVGGVTGSSTSLAGNLYLISADIGTGESTLQWLTTVNPASPTSWVGQPTLTPLDDGTFALLYSVNSLSHASVSLHYRHLDEDGQTLTEKVWTDRELAATSAPVQVDDRLYWVGAGCAAGEVPAFTSHCSGAYVFGLDISDPAAPAALGQPVATPSGDSGGPGDGWGPAVLSFPRSALVAKPAGKAKVGKRLSAVTRGFPAGTTFRYQWYVGAKAVAKATKSSFKVKKTVKYQKNGKTRKITTKGKRLRVSVTARHGGYATTTYTSPRIKVK